MNVKLKAIAIMLIYSLAGSIITYIWYQISDDGFFILGFPMGVGLIWVITIIFNGLVEELNKNN